MAGVAAKISGSRQNSSTSGENQRCHVAREMVNGSLDQTSEAHEIFFFLRWEQLDSESESMKGKAVKKYKVWDLFKTPVLRKRAIVTFFLW